MRDLHLFSPGGTVEKEAAQGRGRMTLSSPNPSQRKTTMDENHEHPLSCSPRGSCFSSMIWRHNKPSHPSTGTLVSLTPVTRATKAF